MCLPVMVLRRSTPGDLPAALAGRRVERERWKERDWVAVKEFKLTYHTGYIYIYIDLN